LKWIAPANRLNDTSGMYTSIEFKLSAWVCMNVRACQRMRLHAHAWMFLHTSVWIQAFIHSCMNLMQYRRVKLQKLCLNWLAALMFIPNNWNFYESVRGPVLSNNRHILIYEYVKPFSMW